MKTQREYVGSLEPELMKHYRKLVQQENYDRRGSDHKILFHDEENHAIKYPIYNVRSINETCLKKEYFIGIDLMANSINVPQMYAIDIGRKSKPFLVMEKLDLIEMNRNQKIETMTQFNKQMQVIIDLKYIPKDISLHSNCGWDKKHRGLYFYDFECWDGPRVDEIMAGRN